MIIPSIDIMGGNAVQLIGGEKKEIDAGSPFKIAEKFSVVGEIAVIDIDAAMGTGNNEEIIMVLVNKYDCRVGGGIRSYESAVKWLDAGASKIIIGTAANRELLSQLPRERVITALDAKNGKIVVEGWKKQTQDTILEKIDELKDLSGGFLVTFVEKEGRMQGFDMDFAKEIIRRAGGSKVTIAGGITTKEEVAELHRLGADAQVGMALYTGRLSLADAFIGALSQEQSLWPTVVVDEFDKALGLVYSNAQSLTAAIENLKGIYMSRKRGLWIKGETSGNTQELLKIDADCDGDSLRFTVKQKGQGFCHNNTWTCWGENKGLSFAYRKLLTRKENAPKDSYVKKLLDNKELLNAKILEEAKELIEANDAEQIKLEASDLLFFTLVKIVSNNVTLVEIDKELYRRTLKITRRPGEAKNRS